MHRVTAVQVLKYLGVSNLSGMPVSSIFVLLSTTDQQKYLHATVFTKVGETVQDIRSDRVSGFV